MANGGIIGLIKVVYNSSTKVTTVTSSGTFSKKIAHQQYQKF